jgi:HTH-like domain
VCTVLEIGRTTYRYEGRQEHWTELRMRMREIAQTRVRYGYRMIRVLLNREGWKVGKDLVYRLCKGGHPSEARTLLKATNASNEASIQVERA